ncbi:MAG: ADP-ribosyltransferase [Bacteroidia bacterium]
MDIHTFIQTYYAKEYQVFLQKPTGTGITVLSDEEKFLIWWYSGLGHSGLNHKLRQKMLGYEIDNQYLCYEQFLNEALEKLTAHLGQSYRGFHTDAANAAKYLQVGTVFTESAFLSTSKIPNVASEFALVGGAKETHILLVILGKSGRVISMLSAAPEEDEILFGSGKLFEVVNIFQDKKMKKKNYYRVTINEIINI